MSVGVYIYLCVCVHEDALAGSIVMGLVQLIRQNTAAIVVSDPAVLHTDLILLAAYPGIIMIITGDSNTNAIIAILPTTRIRYRPVASI